MNYCFLGDHEWGEREGPKVYRACMKCVKSKGSDINEGAKLLRDLD